MALKILHISDIHFKDFKDFKYLDLDQEIQREIEFDLTALKAEYGKIDIVLLGGDIAFSGQENEYQVADTWIKKICEIMDCQEENVLTVPGNHDIERGKLVPLIRNVQKEIKDQKNRTGIDKKIVEIMTHAQSGELIMSPLQNYTAFAQKYGSIPDTNNKLYWEKDFPVDDRILRVRGVNSAFVSSELDNESDSKLVLGSHQTSFLRENGVIYLLLCHHPPTWLLDGDEAFTSFKARARINLFGHKHLFNTDIYNNNCLVLAAGAMQPSRAETGWEPRYNILELSISSRENKSTLDVKLFKRVWNKHDLKFKTDFTEDGKVFEEYHLNLTSEEAHVKDQPKTEINVQPAINDEHMTNSVIDPSVPDPRRKLAYLFLGLPYHIKLKIAVDLSLIDDSDKGLDEIQRSQAYFKRANEKNLFKQLWDAINTATDSTLYNPFTTDQQDDSKPA